MDIKAYKKFSRAKHLYNALTRRQCGHIMNPNDPMKKKYKEVSKDYIELYDKEFEDMYYTIESFNDLFFDIGES